MNRLPCPGPQAAARSARGRRRRGGGFQGGRQVVLVEGADVGTRRDDLVDAVQYVVTEDDVEAGDG